MMNDTRRSSSSLSPVDRAIALLDQARSAVPIVNYALGIVGVAAAAFLVLFFLRDGNIILAIFGMFIAMIVLFVFASVANLPPRYKTYVGLFGVTLVGLTTVFFCASLFLSLSAVAFGKPESLARLFTKAPQVQHKPGHWIHPGGSSYSDMRLEIAGETLKYFYLNPRAGIAEQSVMRGDLFFEGTMVGGQYVGTARIFKRGCVPISFPVSGTVQASEFIAVEGNRPDFESEGCKDTAQLSLTRLVFMRIGD
jgi:hypothetical protein